MIRATTPKHTFIFETDPDAFSRILITYAQGNDIIMEKEKDDLTIEAVEVPICHCCEDFSGFSDEENGSSDSGSSDPIEEETRTEWHAYFRLTQEETKKFKATPGAQVRVQVRVLTYAGEALASDKKIITVQDVLNDEVLV